MKKLKKCKECGKPELIFGYGMCRNCYNMKLSAHKQSQSSLTFQNWLRKQQGKSVSVLETIKKPEHKKPKAKMCKGNYRADHFNGCGKEKTIFRFGLCQSCYVAWLSTGSENATKQIKAIAVQAKKNVASKNKSNKKKAKDDLKGITAWKDDLQKVVNWIVRELDKDLPCISHPTMKNFIRYDAGHYISRGVSDDIRYNVHNIHKQNSFSNERYGGDANFTKGLELRYGENYVMMIEDLRLKYKGISKRIFTIDNIRHKFLPAARKLKREMKKGFSPTRDQVNEIIGIYIPENEYMPYED